MGLFIVVGASILVVSSVAMAIIEIRDKGRGRGGGILNRKKNKRSIWDDIDRPARTVKQPAILPPQPSLGPLDELEELDL